MRLKDKSEIDYILILVNMLFHPQVGVMWLFISLCASSLLGLSMPYHHTTSSASPHISLTLSPITHHPTTSSASPHISLTLSPITHHHTTSSASPYTSLTLSPIKHRTLSLPSILPSMYESPHYFMTNACAFFMLPLILVAIILNSQHSPPHTPMYTFPVSITRGMHFFHVVAFPVPITQSMHFLYVVASVGRHLS